MELGNINLEKGELFAFLETQTHISGLSDSWVYVGMKYAPFCWHAEDLYLPALNYHYEGDVKTWYFIPPSDADKYEAYFKIKFQEQLK
jgi:histone demethylase JARID1